MGRTRSGPCGAFRGVSRVLAVRRGHRHGRRAEHRVRARQLHEVRIPDPDARRREALHVRLRAQGRRADIPILLTRTPYSVAPYGADAYKASLGPSDRFMRDGYIFVYQDVRGRMMSEGQFADVRPHLPVKSGPADIDESTDTYDTIEWLLKNVPNHNGRVGMYGISYPGFYTSAGMIDAHPALKAASPQAPIADWFVGDDFHHNGALYLSHAFGFFSGFGRPRPKPTTSSGSRFDFGTEDGFQFYMNVGPMPNVNARYFKGEIGFWTDLMAHETYDAFWQARNLRPHLKNIKPAVMTVGGWFDAEDLFGALETYKSIERQSPGAANILVMGPWAHGGWARGDGDFLGDVRFGAKTAQFYRDEIELPFFSYPPQGQGRSETARGLRVRDGAQPVAAHGRLAASASRGEGPLPGVRRTAQLAGARRRRRVRPVRQRPGQARAVHQPHRHRHDARAHGRRPALRVTQARRAHVHDGRAGGGSHRRRPDQPEPPGVHHGHRLGLGGEADRRLPGRVSGIDPGRGPGAGPARRRPHGRLPAARARRGDAREVPRRATRSRSRSCPEQVTRVEYVMPDVFHTFRAATGSWCRSRVRGSRS